MFLEEMFTRCVVTSGQYLIPDQVLELKLDKFKILVESTLGVYNNYVPHVKHLYVNVASTRQYTFDALSPDGIPDWVSELIPVRISGVAPFFLTEYGRVGSELNVKKPFPYEYRKPVLTVPMTAEFDLTAVYYHKLVEGTWNNEPSFQCTTITPNDDEFFDLLTGKFLISLGKSRRAFTLNEIQITTDASEMVAEGKEMEKDALQDIQENKSRWYLAWG